MTKNSRAEVWDMQVSSAEDRAMGGIYGEWKLCREQDCDKLALWSWNPKTTITQQARLLKKRKQKNPSVSPAGAGL